MNPTGENEHENRLTMIESSRTMRSAGQTEVASFNPEITGTEATLQSAFSCGVTKPRHPLMLWLCLLLLLIPAAGCSALRPDTLGCLESLPSRPLPADLAERLPEDLRKFADLRLQLTELQTAQADLIRRLCRSLERDGRRHYAPQEEEALRDGFGRCLRLRHELLELAATYRAFDAAADEPSKTRAMLLYAAAALASQELDLRIAGCACRRDGHRWLLRRKLDEPDAAGGIPQSAFDMICRSAASWRGREIRRLIVERIHRAQNDGGLVGESLDAQSGEVLASATASAAYLDAHQGDADTAWGDVILASGAEAAYVPWYELVKACMLTVSAINWPRTYCVTPELIRQVSERLEPGDIIFVRRFGHLTNVFIPGFWTHSMIYLGGGQDLRRLGMADAAGRLRLAQGSKPPDDSGPPEVLETDKRGVLPHPLVEALNVDCVLVFRPKLSDGERAKALRRAFAYHGDPYDFDFDFHSADRLTCTELLYRAYGDMLNLRPRLMYGRSLMSAQDIVDSLVHESVAPDGRASFVLMLMGNPDTNAARWADKDEIPVKNAD